MPRGLRRRSKVQKRSWQWSRTVQELQGRERYQRLITQWAHGVTAISDLNANVCDRIFSLEVQPALGMLGQRSK
jgi:hypothetical protein